MLQIEPAPPQDWPLWRALDSHLTLLLLKEAHRRQGFGRAAMALWESELVRAGHRMVLVSTRADESAQHFYRTLGYRDCGCLLLDAPGYGQPAELFLSKPLP